MSVPTAETDRTIMLRIVAWLVARHHASLGLWPWTWTGPRGEAHVTLYARCIALRFGDDFGALATWIEANSWPPPDDTPHPTTLFRDRPGFPQWARNPPISDGGSRQSQSGLEVEQLARGGAAIETVAQLLAADSGLDQYLAELAPQRHGGHDHRGAAGGMAVLVMQLATDLALHLGWEYAIPWTGPAGGQPNGVSDPDWSTFQARYGLDHLPFPPHAQDVFTFGDRGWLHAGGWLGDARGSVLRLGPDAPATGHYPTLRSIALALLGA